MLSVTVKPFMLSVIMMNVVILSVVVLNVVAPYIDPLFKLVRPVSSINNSRVKTSHNICFGQVFWAVIIFCSKVRVYPSGAQYGVLPYQKIISG